MAMIGHNSAVAEMGQHHHELHGTVAFLTWLGVHAWLMSGVRPRVDAFMAWAWDFFSDQPGVAAARPRDAAAHRLGRRRPTTRRPAEEATHG